MSGVEAVDRALEELRARGIDPESPGGAVILQHLLSNSTPGPSNSPTAPARATDADVPEERLADWAGVDVESINDIFEFMEDGVGLGLASGRLPSSRADRQRALALLKLAGDRIGFGAPEVPATGITRITADFGCLDQNLHQNLAGRSSWIARRGKRGAFTYRITKPGLDRTAELVQALAHGEEVITV